MVEAGAERRGIIKAEASTREKIAEEALEEENTRREKVEGQLGVATEALVRESEEAE